MRRPSGGSKTCGANPMSEGLLNTSVLAAGAKCHARGRKNANHNIASQQMKDGQRKVTQPSANPVRRRAKSEAAAPAPTKKTGIQLLSWSEMMSQPKPTWLVKGLLPKGLSCLYSKENVQQHATWTPDRRPKMTPRIASRGNVTGGSRGRSLMVRLEWRGCWRAGGRA